MTVAKCVLHFVIQNCLYFEKPVAVATAEMANNRLWHHQVASCIDLIINYLNRGAQGIDIVALGIDFVAVRAWAQSVCRLE